MLGRLIIGAIAAGMAWKYRDVLRNYLEHPDQLLDQAREGLSAGMARARDKARAGVSDDGPAR
jgi:hypothetical protein